MQPQMLFFFFLADEESNSSDELFTNYEHTCSTHLVENLVEVMQNRCTSSTKLISYRYKAVGINPNKKVVSPLLQQLENPEMYNLKC